MVTRDELERMLADLRREVEDPRAGIYGPGSSAWKISKEAVLFLGGGRAALLQTAHPFVAHGVDQHSRTKHDPLGRFQRTFDNVFAMVFGDLDAAERSARRVHAIHTRIRGQLSEASGRFPQGADYLANDEEALMWVHGTLIDSAVQVYDLCVRQLCYQEKDAYYQQTRRFARLFGIPDRVIPRDWAAFEAYNRRMWSSDTLAVGRPAMELRRFLFKAPQPAARPIFRWIELMTAGLLPPRLRADYGFRWTARERLAFGASLRALRATYPHLPPRLRHLPAYVNAQRRLAGKLGPDPVGAWLERVALSALKPPRRATSSAASQPVSA